MNFRPPQERDRENKGIVADKGVLQGLQEGEQVVEDGAFVLRSELLGKQM
jgi:hypothetical protein